MKGLGITLKGIEDVAVLEVNELIKRRAAAADGAVVFEASPEDLCALCYRAQSLSRVLLLLFEFGIEELESGIAAFKLELGKRSLKEWTGTFRVVCQREGKHDFSSQEFAAKAGGAIAELTKSKVDLENPEVIFYAYISGRNGYLGIDFTGFDSSKREHNIFSHPSSINSCLAYALMRLSGYDGKKEFLDAFAKSGQIAIEAGLFATKLAVNHYRKEKLAFKNLKALSINAEKLFREIDKKAGLKNKKIHCVDSLIANVRAAEKNAKIAGINKAISFSRMDASWLDTKFRKGRISYAASFFSISGEEAAKTAKEYFYQMEYILERKGRIAVMAKSGIDLEKYAAEYKFRTIEKREIKRGDGRNTILVFEKAAPKP